MSEFGLLEKEIVILIKTKPFYAHFIQTMRRISTDSIETMGVNITDQINLYINPKFYNSLSVPERVAVLEHEVLHIINKHIIRGKKFEQRLFNIACDIAINQYINETYNKKEVLLCKLPKDALLPEKFNLEPELTAEEYYKELYKNAVKISCQGQGKGKGKGKGQGKSQDKNGQGNILDDHSLWGEGNKNEDFQHQVIKNTIRKTLERTKDYGTLPSNILAEIKKALRHETLNWRAILQKFIYRATIVNNVPTRKKANRRYGIYFDGSRVECKLDMLVAIDTSGSISDTDLALFFSEIEKIKALGMSILVVECDADIQKVYKYKNTPRVVSGRGGTDFKPVFKFARKQKPNCIVYLTDLEANLNFTNVSRVPTLWAITINGGEAKQVPFGIGVKLKEE